jgi:phage-related tail protein
MRFEVEPRALTGQAPVIGRQGGLLAELAGEVQSLAGVAGATGSPEASVALERFARVWSETVLLMAEAVGALGAATGEAAAAYAATDAGVIPAGG